jgi:hypothetical protein
MLLPAATSPAAAARTDSIPREEIELSGGSKSKIDKAPA